MGTTWTYDTNTNDRRLKAINNSGATRSFNFTTTPENLFTQIQETALAGSAWAPKTWSYSYDNSYRLTEASSSAGIFAYAPDPADNITSFQSPSGNTSATYNNLNEIANLGSQAYVYDKNGNVLDDGVRTYTWDAENRLLSITSKAQPSHKTSFRYDGFGRRVAIDTANGALASETRYLWCGQQLCQARTSADAVSRRYYSEGEYLPLGGTSLYYAQDQIGSARDVLAAQNGSRVASFDYEPYGNPSQSSGRISTDFRFAGMFYDQQDGLDLTEYRAYDPRAGRWLSRDPLGEAEGVNISAYVGNNPVSVTDPLGLEGQSGITGWFGTKYDQFTNLVSAGKPWLAKPLSWYKTGMNWYHCLKPLLEVIDAIKAVAEEDALGLLSAASALFKHGEESGNWGCCYNKPPGQGWHNVITATTCTCEPRQ